jgi:acyl-coenzyme A thioesterase PaaI-like protein
MDPLDEGRALQDLAPVHCFGCGSLNPKGLQIKSRPVGRELVCRWRPAPHHIGHPGILHGGTLAAVIDCHAIWASIAHRCRETGHDLADGPAPFAFVTGRLTVDYLKPAAIDAVLELRAEVVEPGERKHVVRCRVVQGDLEVARAEVVTVRVAVPPARAEATPK